MLDLDTPLNSATTRVTDVVWFKARDDVRVGGRVAMPRGTPIRASVIGVKPAIVNGKNQKTEIHVRLEEIPLESGGSLAISADNLRVEGERFGATVGSTAQNTLGQATQGAMLGGSISRSAKGAAIGAVAAVGAGILSSVLQGHGPTSDVDLPSGSVFEAKLQRPIDIPDPTMLAKNVPNIPLPNNANPPTAPNGTVATSVSISQPNSPGASDAPNPSVPTFDPLTVPETPPVANGTSEAAVNDKPAEATGRDVSEVVSRAPLKWTSILFKSTQSFETVRENRWAICVVRIFGSSRRDGKEFQFFSRDKLPLAVALVIDRSGSVAPLMNQVQNAAYQALQLLKPGDQVLSVFTVSEIPRTSRRTDNQSATSGKPHRMDSCGRRHDYCGCRV